MLIFLLTFALFLLVFLLMAIGYLLQRKRISGSCGGLGAIGIDKECDCPEPCDARLAREAEQARRQRLQQGERIL
ncbi:(Na+)-NQR maturation NqrM [Pseudaeromonas sharmana]|uniref:(Na+)-NQR maturation NqrM n=1 Tax=Pseudaeromonas sharmana TaxID=328412 RepID=A0ABV8CSB9_9GAMM